MLRESVIKIADNSLIYMGSAVSPRTADGRLTRISVVVPDKPGSVYELTGIIAKHRANIFDLSQSRPVSDVQLGQAEIALTLETKGWEHVDEIAQSIQEAGFAVIVMSPRTSQENRWHFNCTRIY